MKGIPNINTFYWDLLCPQLPSLHTFLSACSETKPEIPKCDNIVNTIKQYEYD